MGQALAQDGSSGGGGGGGGRAVPGNNGQNGNSGAAANPTAHNCKTVTPGASYPVTVNSGGQVFVSWNPQ